MALRISASRLGSLTATKSGASSIAGNYLLSGLQRRSKGTDAGDVIGIDLGTTNSCVAIMVRINMKRRAEMSWEQSGVLRRGDWEHASLVVCGSATKASSNGARAFSVLIERPTAQAVQKSANTNKIR